MFNSAEWLALVNKLHQLTEAGRVEWTYDRGMLTLIIGEVSYEISSADDDGAPPWLLSVSKVTDWTPEAIDAIASKAGWDTDDPQVRLLDLRDIAYRMAMGGPQLARNLLAELDRIDPTEPSPPTSPDPF